MRAVWLCARDGVADGEEYVSDFGHVGKVGSELLGIWVAHEEVRHGWPQETDAGLWVLGEDLPFQPSERGETDIVSVLICSKHKPRFCWVR